jgi:hypothetical protein
MKKSNQKVEPNQEGTEEINWAVIGPILAIMLGTIIWALFF